MSAKTGITGSYLMFKYAVLVDSRFVGSESQHKRRTGK
jgi:hypothetical protein